MQQNLERRERLWNEPVSKTHFINPHHVVAAPADWLQWEYSHGCGDRHGLKDYADRAKIWWDLLADPTVSDCQINAWRYLLGMQ